MATCDDEQTEIRSDLGQMSKLIQGGSPVGRYEALSNGNGRKGISYILALTEHDLLSPSRVFLCEDSLELCSFRVLNSSC